jgi:hypothetical protein
MHMQVVRNKITCSLCLKKREISASVFCAVVPVIDLLPFSLLLVSRATIIAYTWLSLFSHSPSIRLSLSFFYADIDFDSKSLPLFAVAQLNSTTAASLNDFRFQLSLLAVAL